MKMITINAKKNTIPQVIRPYIDTSIINYFHAHENNCNRHSEYLYELISIRSAEIPVKFVISADNIMK